MKVKDKERQYDYDTGVVQNENEEKKLPAKKAGTIILIEKTGSLYITFIADIDEGKLYFSDWANFTFNARLADYKGELTKENYKELLGIFDRCQTDKWESEYIGSNNGTTARYEWVLDFEAKGKVRRHYGFGAFGNNKPETYDILKDAIISFAKKYTVKDNRQK